MNEQDPFSMGQTPPVMDNAELQQPAQIPQKKGASPKWIIYVLIVAIGLSVAGIGVGVYYYLTKEDKEEATPEVSTTDTSDTDTTNDEQDSNDTDTEDSDTEDTSDSDTSADDQDTEDTLYSTIPLQDLINQYCIKSEINGQILYNISKKQLPFNISETYVNILGYNEDVDLLNCITGDNYPNKGYVTLFTYYYDDDSTQYFTRLWDEQSDEDAHFSLEGAIKVSSTSSYELWVRVEQDELSAGTPYDSVAKMIVRRILTYQGNYKLYVETYLISNHFTNEDFVEFLLDNSTKDQNGIYRVDYTKATEQYAQTYFADINALEKNEKSAYEKAMAFIEAIVTRGN